jgi:transposase
MRKIKDLLRLKFQQRLSHRQIAQSLGISVGGVHAYLQRAQEAQVTWPQSEQIPESELEKRLFPSARLLAPEPVPLPDWANVKRELARKGVTLLLLWEEYRAKHPTGLGYSQFCRRFDAYNKALDPRMRQSHKAGEKLFVDYAGMTLSLSDPTTGQGCQAQIFVATMGASSYTYAEATLTQSVPDWIGAHVRAFAFFGGTPELLVCDNLKTGITKACFYDPGVQRTYQEMAAHYGCAVLPARVRKPRDKPKVESGVQNVEQRVLAPLRDHTFFHLATLNEALAPLLRDMNTRPMQGTKLSRADLFADLDRPCLRPLPSTPYEVGIWSRERVPLDYHLRVDERFYSVPYTLLQQELDVRQSGNIVEIFHQGERVSSHGRVLQKYGRSTYPEHMPSAHREVTRWTRPHLLERAGRCGPYTVQVAEAIFAQAEHGAVGIRSCLGLLRLGERHGVPAVEAACQRAVAAGVPSYLGVQALLAQDTNSPGGARDQAAGDATAVVVPELPPVRHDNIRGAAYYAPPRAQTLEA